MFNTESCILLPTACRLTSRKSEKLAINKFVE
jgi:hypothetical protein